MGFNLTAHIVNTCLGQPLKCLNLSQHHDQKLLSMPPILIQNNFGAIFAKSMTRAPPTEARI